MSADYASEVTPLCELDATLKSLSSHPYVRDWSPGKSIYKLLYIFCLPELDGLLNAIWLLSSSASDLDLRTLAFRCVEEGEVAQLASLLLFAWDSLVPPFSETEGSHRGPVAQLIIKELVRADVEGCLFKSGGDWNPHIIKKVSLTSAWEALTVVTNVSELIVDYRKLGRAKEIPKFEVPYDIAYMIWHKFSTDTRRILNPEDVYSDDIPCLHPQLNPEEKGSFKKALQSQIQKGKSSMIDLPVPVFNFRLAYRNSSNPDLSIDDIEKLPLHPELKVKFALRKVIEEDKREIFVEFIKLSVVNGDTIEEVRSSILKEDAVNCFAAILDGEMDGPLTLDGILPPDAPAGWTILHEAALSNATSIASLLVERGFDANSRSQCLDLNLDEALPLQIVLANARLVCMNEDRWTGRKSAIGLIMRLSGRTMSGFLETVRVLAMKTNDVKQIFFKYLKEGRMLEVGALLMVARKQLLSSSDDAGFKNIEDLRDLLVNSYSDIGPVDIQFDLLWNDAQMEKKETWALLEIFEKSGDAITAYIQQEDRLKIQPQQRVLEIASILQDAGFKVTHKDAYMLSEFRPLGQVFGRTFLHLEYEKNYVRPSWEADLEIHDKQAGDTSVHPWRSMLFKPMSLLSSVTTPCKDWLYGTMSRRPQCASANGWIPKTTFGAKPHSTFTLAMLKTAMKIGRRIIARGR